MNTNNNLSVVGIVGAGQMGAGIAQVVANNGFETLLYDSSLEVLNFALKNLEQSLNKLKDKGKISTEQVTQTLSKIKKVDDLNQLNQADLIIEAIVENIEIKSAVFKQLDQSCKSSTVFASNTSSISITKLASVTKRPEQVIGMHFMNPVPVMKLVEVIRGLQTSEDTYQAIYNLAVKLGKTVVTARRDYPGFIVNRILMPMINEAVFVLMEGIATEEEIDTAMKLGTNQPMGPLELADFVGLDTCLAITQIFHRELGDDKYRPCPLMIKYVEAGWLGRKTKRGFYQY